MMLASSILVISLCLFANVHYVMSARRSGAGSVVGINLSPSGSSIAVYKQLKLDIIANDERLVQFPSVESLVCNNGVDTGDINAYTIATRGSNASSINVVETEYQTNKFNVEKVSWLLERMKSSVETYLSTTVSQAVITIPLSLGTTDRDIINSAAEATGLEIRLVNDIIAATMRYKLQKKDNEKILVINVDRESTTFTQVIFNQGVDKVLSSSEIAIGGDAIAERIVKHFIIALEREFSIKVSLDLDLMDQLYVEANKAKDVFSTEKKYNIVIPKIDSGNDYNFMFSRKTFEHLNKDLFQSIVSHVQSLLNRDGKDGFIKHVVFCGSSSEIPILHEAIESVLTDKSVKVYAKRASTTILHGAALMAYEWSNEISEQREQKEL